MSELLRSLEGRERAEECARNDATRKFTESELLEGDVFNTVDKASKAHARNDAAASAAQMQWLDAMRRAGW